MKASEIPKDSGVESSGVSAPTAIAPAEKSKPLNLFQKIQSAMRHVPDFGQTCRRILDAVMDEMEAENCSIMLKDPASEDLLIRAARGKGDGKSVFYTKPSAPRRPFRSGEGIAGWVLKEGQAVLLSDARAEPRFAKAVGSRNEIRSLICYPIRERDQVVGVFNLSHSKKGAFDDKDKYALGYISNQLGAVLTSVRFFLEIQKMDRRLKDPQEPSEPGKDPIEALPSSGPEGNPGLETPVFIWASDRMRQVREMIDRVANTDVTVFIQGESGVGKEVVARFIHSHSSRRERPFIKVNCAALPSELLESELFGYEKGAFTGAYRQKPGRFELAQGGTIFLDEIVEISPSLQAKLLQVLQDREFSRLGGKKDIQVDIRVLAATNRNIEEAVQSGRFREDLYYRLNVVSIVVPPLRERKEEIPVLVEYFLDKFKKKYSRKVKSISPRLMKFFEDHFWPGNVRELENVVHRYCVLGSEEAIVEEFSSPAKESRPAEKVGSDPARKPRRSLREVHREAVIQAESEAIRQILELTKWNRKKAARQLNISYKALLYKIKQCGIIK